MTRATAGPAAPTRRDAARWPSVGVVVPAGTASRYAAGTDPTLRRAVESVLAQDYPGPVRVVVVHDREAALNAEPPTGACRPAGGAGPTRGRIATVLNWRTPGTPGCRNTGALALDCDLIAFCHPGDAWQRSKLYQQVLALLSTPGAEFVTCATETSRAGRRMPRLAGRTRVDPADLRPAPLTVLHPSGFLIRRESLCARDGLGLFTEHPAARAASDWDMLLRAARRAQIVHVDAALVRVPPTQPLPRRSRHDARAAALRWMRAHHPDVPGQGVRVATRFTWYALCAAATGSIGASTTFVAALVSATVQRRHAGPPGPDR